MAKTQRDDRLGDVNNVLWWAGWNGIILALLGIVFGIVGAFSGESALPLLVAVVAIATWVFGIQEINSSYSSVLEEYSNYSKEMANTALQTVGTDATTHILAHSEGSVPFIKPAKTFRSTVIVVGDRSVSQFATVHLDMVKREPGLSDESREVYYDQVTGVSYERPYLEIQTSGGSTMKIQSTREPDDVLNDLQQRVREYKSVTV